MADVEHSAIVHANTHEPKHITTSATTDSGKVITPSSSSAGASVLRQLSIADFNYASVPHINIEIIGNASSDARTIASDTTLHTTGDYAAIVRFTEDLDNAKVDFTFNSGTGEITCNQAGTYSIDIDLSVSSDTADTLVGVRYGVGADYFSSGTAPVLKGVCKASGDVVNIAGSREVLFADADVVTIGAAVDKTCALTIHESSITIRRVQ